MRSENAFPFFFDYFPCKGGKLFPDIDLPYQWMTLVIVDIKRMGPHHLFAITPINHVAKMYLDNFNLEHLIKQLLTSLIE